MEYNSEFLWTPDEDDTLILAVTDGAKRGVSLKAVLFELEGKHGWGERRVRNRMALLRKVKRLEPYRKTPRSPKDTRSNLPAPRMELRRYSGARPNIARPPWFEEGDLLGRLRARR
jgi:hypothetical protein